MERILSETEPKDVFKYFEDICNIPHVSFHTDELRDYCERFAINNGLKYNKDDKGNIVIYKNATNGYEDHAPVIIQGHLDMVGAKSEDSDHDFLSDSLQLEKEYLEQGYIKAHNTTLGGDDGIAIAYALAILASDTIKHPALEVVFTTNEEVGLLGASDLDMSFVSGTTLLNLDSEEEDIYLTGSAGGLRSDTILKCKLERNTEKILEITICGLMGGHSGTEIGKGRASANILMGRLLNQIYKKYKFRFVSIHGGEVDNAICPKCVSQIAISEKFFPEIKALCAEYVTLFRNEYAFSDNMITINCEERDNALMAVNTTDTEKILFLSDEMLFGVQGRNPETGFIETSVNPGILNLNNDEFFIGYSVRSSIESAKKNISNKLEHMAAFIGAEYKTYGDYPSWPYKKESRLRDIIEQIYSEKGEKPVFETIHAGLECGIFVNAVPEMDIVSYGPNIFDIHTHNEKLEIESVQRVYEFTKELLARL